ncbi:MAG: toll/interleukin-1 receptor domain-containing protein [Verrucomicrobiota bacterium]
MPNQSFDIFLSYNSKDKKDAERLAIRLRDEYGLRVWYDAWEIKAGTSVLQALEGGIKNCRAAAVLVGADGVGPWEQEEVEALLRFAVQRKLPVFPVLLPDAPDKSELPILLMNRHYVDFRSGFDDTETQKIVNAVRDEPDNVRPSKQTGARSGVSSVLQRYLRPCAAIVAVAAAIGLVVSHKGSCKPPPPPPDQFNVHLMDSSYINYVYNPVTAHKRLTNLTDIKPILRALRIHSFSQTLVSDGWSEGDDIRNNPPDLMIMHLSSFAVPEDADFIEGDKRPVATDGSAALIDFLDLMSSNTTTFIIYSRIIDPSERKKADLIDRLSQNNPALGNRIHLLRVETKSEYSNPFDDPQNIRNFKKLVRPFQDRHNAQSE